MDALRLSYTWDRGFESVFLQQRVSCELVQRPQDHHYAFPVSDAEFDAALPGIRASGVKHYANFRRERPGEINHLYGGRGVYFDDPNGHLLEQIRPYPRRGI